MPEIRTDSFARKSQIAEKAGDTNLRFSMLNHGSNVLVTSVNACVPLRIVAGRPFSLFKPTIPAT